MRLSRATSGLLIVLVVLSVVSTPVNASQQVVGRPDISVYAPNNEVIPGEKTTLQLYLSNIGDIHHTGPAQYEDRITTARAATVAVSAADSPIKVHTEAYPVGRVPEGVTGPIPISLTVPRTVSPGTYTLSVEIEYSYTFFVDYSSETVEYNNGHRTQTTAVTVRVPEQPQFAIQNTSTTAVIGGKGESSITIENTGSTEIRDVTARLRSASDEVHLGAHRDGAAAFRDRWGAGEVQTFKFSTAFDPDSPRRAYPLSVNISYVDENGIRQYPENLTGAVTPQQAHSFTISDIDSSLHIGEPGTVSGTIKNTGTTPVSNATLVYNSANEHLNPNSRAYSIGQLPPGEERNFTYTISVADSASVSRQQLEFQLRYRDSQSNQYLSKSLTPTVELLPERKWLDVTPRQTTFAVDTDNQLRVYVRNVETQSLSDLRLRLRADSPLSTQSELAYINRLASGESETVAFGLTVNEDAIATTSFVSVEVTAERPDGERIHVDTYTVPIEVTEESQSRTLPFILGALLLAVVAVWWWRSQ